ncbi:MAG: ferrous iron transporter B, partial [Caldilineaceae bacterium]|nr:ferrous iron transporter B [Caldilineaceae bacterium]
MSSGPLPSQDAATVDDLLTRADLLRRELSSNFRDQLVQALYADAEQIAGHAVKATGSRGWDWDQRIDRLITSPLWGLPIMVAVLSVVFWITIVGANYPSQWLAAGLFAIEEAGSALFTAWRLPWWLTGFLWHGIFRGTAWVVSVMLPPMAIFFPLFTILE